MTHTLAVWPVCTAVALAAVIDICERRIPNWLVIPLLVSGILAGAATAGPAGLKRSLLGLLVAAGVAGPFWYLRGLGMGDVKLLAGVGAWLGPAQLISALVATAIAGGMLAVGVAIRRGSLLQCLEGAGELLTGFWRRGFRPHSTLTLDHAGTIKIPYAVAIAVGTWFSFMTL
jgi:prepilin peptidase CpaA